MTKKLSRKDEATLRALLYNIAQQGFDKMQIITEPVSNGRLITMEQDGATYYATLNITLHNPEKFNVEEVRNEYLTKLEAAAQRSAKKAEKDRLKAQKAQQSKGENKE